MVGKIIGPLFSKLFLDDISAKNDSTPANDSVSFRVVEDKKTFSVYDDSGEEIFQIDKGA